MWVIFKTHYRHPFPKGIVELSKKTGMFRLDDLSKFINFLTVSSLIFTLDSEEGIDRIKEWWNGVDKSTPDIDGKLTQKMLKNGFLVNYEVKMITVTKKQIIDYILSQPPDREIDFGGINVGDKCGCLMLQYGREVLKETQVGVGTYSWYVGCFTIARAEGWDFGTWGTDHKTYRTLQEKVRKTL